MIGVYFNDIILLSGDPLYNISLLFTPIVVQLFILGGVIIIIGELIVTKDIYLFTRKYPIELGGELLYVLVSLLVLQQLPSNVGVFLSLLFVLGFVLLFLVLHSHYLYGVSFCIVLLYGFEVLDMFHLINLPPIIYTITVVLLMLIVLYIITMTIIQRTKRKSILSNVILLTIIFLSVGVNVLHQQIYDTSYRSFSGVPGEYPMSFCTPIDDIEDGLFLNVTSKDELFFPCDTLDYGIATFTERAPLYTYLLFVPLPLISLVAYHYGKAIKLDISSTRTKRKPL
jgi:hypothetical protein